jgi:ribosomal protein S18 acetylase RimI-like enzyme
MRGEGSHPTIDVELLSVTARDEVVLWEMLRLAAYAEDRSVADVRRDPDLARYVDGWERVGDIGIKAVHRGGGTAVGAAWSRLWRADDRGYGYIDEHTPELAIAVAAAYRGKGVGRRMLDALIRTVARSYAALSLSVRVDNPALRLYREVGFEELDGSDVTDRAAGTSVTMRLDLTGRRWVPSDCT